MNGKGLLNRTVKNGILAFFRLRFVENVFDKEGSWDYFLRNLVREDGWNTKLGKKKENIVFKR